MGILNKIRSFVKKNNEQYKGQGFILTFSIDGANCHSCVYAIEKVTSKFDNVLECNYLNNSLIEVRCELLDKHENEIIKEVSEKFITLVNRLGYNAILVKN